jgi:hypothetical protein
MIIDEFGWKGFRKSNSDRVFPDTRWANEVDDGVRKVLSR